MPQITNIAIQLRTTAGATTSAKAQSRQWTGQDARSKALIWGGGIFFICLAMLPIPLVHFAIIPVLLIGLPVTLFAVYKMYSHGVDIVATVNCPACQASFPLQKSADEDDWPLITPCPSCRTSLEITRVP